MSIILAVEIAIKEIYKVTSVLSILLWLYYKYIENVLSNILIYITQMLQVILNYIKYKVSYLS
jgi:hypothetical protein